MQPHHLTETSHSSASVAHKRRALPATRMPVRGDSRRTSSVVSLLLHIALVLLLIAPAAVHTGIVIEKPQGAGGVGPAGGGGGGHNGSGGQKERVRYVQVTPPPAPTPTPTPKVVPPPVVKPPEPKPVVPPPQPVTPPTTQPEPKIDVKVEAKPTEATAPVVGTGGGTGRDGTNGTGPGTGGGVGSGNGTGRGSGNGPGTGGGVQPNYAPTAIELFIPPLPVPGKVHGFHLIVEFDVDSTGKVLKWTFNSTGDGGYDRKLDDVLKGTRFRPGTTPDGKPIRMKAQIIYDF
ncbi:MAG TPA: hypothetical protein VGM50_11590 [Gemmatimonadaceae bacterium]